jgi:DNA-directed RNA polymerase subunit RPC12/RpoP
MEIVKVYCAKCKKEVVPIKKIFNTMLCPNCNIILSSDCGIDKAGS